jgi:hypothetical protein
MTRMTYSAPTGSNSYRTRAWKSELAALATETGLAVTVCHFPPGTSKWNKVEHRLFSHITLNWRGRPLTSHEVVVETIAATRTRTGLQVQAQLDTGSYPLGVSVSTARMRALPVTPHSWCGSWNYTINPATQNTDQQASAVAQNTTLARSQTLKLLSNPVLTGMTGQELDELVAQLAPARAAQTAQRCYARRGGRRRNAPRSWPAPAAHRHRPRCAHPGLSTPTLLPEGARRTAGDQPTLHRRGNRGHPPATRRTRTHHHLAHHHAVHHRGRPVAVFDNRRGAHRATTRARPVV